MNTAARVKQDSSMRISYSDPAYGEVMDFLIEEANLLDTDCHNEWLELIHNDIEYRVPSRSVRYRRAGSGFDWNDSNTVVENILTLQFRVHRSVDLDCALDREPPPVIRRFVSNVAVRRTASPTEFDVSSYLLLFWIYNAKITEAPPYDILSARREDVLTQTPEGLRLLKRTVLVDHATMASLPNIFF